MYQYPFNKHIYMFVQILYRSFGSLDMERHNTQIRTKLKQPTSEHKLIRNSQFPLFWPIPHPSYREHTEPHFVLIRLYDIWYLCRHRGSVNCSAVFPFAKNNNRNELITFRLLSAGCVQFLRPHKG